METSQILLFICVLGLVILLGIWITLLKRTPSAQNQARPINVSSTPSISGFLSTYNRQDLRDTPFIALFDPMLRDEIRKRLVVAKTMNLAIPLQNMTREQLLAIPGVLSVVPNTTMYALVRKTKEQLGVITTTQSLSGRGKRTLVYVLDTGVNCIPLVGEYDMTGDGPRDVADHGTWVATAIKEIVPDADIISIKVLGDDGSAPTSVIAAGLDQAYQDAQEQYATGKYDRIFLNMSLGGFPNDAMDIAASQGEKYRVLNFVASGNSFIGRVGSPGRSPEVITVGALDGLTNRATFSQFQESISKPDVSTPGVALEASDTRCKISAKTGTSMATPVALALVGDASQDSTSLANMTPEKFREFKNKIIYSSGKTWNKDGTGFSKLNVSDLEKAFKIN